MGFWDTIGDLYEAAKPWGEAEAEAPPAEEKEAEVNKPSIHRFHRAIPPV